MSSLTYRAIVFFRDEATPATVSEKMSRKDAQRFSDRNSKLPEVVKVEIVDVCATHSNPTLVLQSGFGQLS